MTAPTTDGYLENAARTVAEMKTAIDQNRDAMCELLGCDDDFSTNEELTISSGSVTPTRAIHSIDTESDASTDDLANIVTTNHPESRLLLIYPESAARTVVVKDTAGGAGQIHTADGNDFSMDEVDKRLLLYRSGTDWYEILRAYGSSLDDCRTYLGLGSAAEEDVGTAANEVVQLNGSAELPAVSGANVTLVDNRQYILIEDQKSAGTNGGSASATTWNVRDLNTEVADEPGAASLSSNQITLTAGTYYCRISAPAYRVTTHKIRLHETTSTLADIYGTCEMAIADYNAQTRSVLAGKFTISSANESAGQNIFEVQHYTTAASSTTGLGYSTNVGTEVYTIAEFWKVR